MLFNSFEFIAIFLPLSILAYYFCRRFNHRLAFFVLTLFSMFYYAWWSPKYLLLLMISTVINYQLAGLLRKFPSRWLLGGAIGFNLLLLGYFKYYGFAVENIVRATGMNLTVPDIILPLGISFFVFQKIAYLVDTWRGKVSTHTFLDFSLFVSFFPQLIAGPIVHHSEMMPQFHHRKDRPLFLGNLSIGLTLFTIGLFKKVIIADNLAAFASPVYAAAAGGQEIDFYAAWVAALGFTFQLYFDFSGYSDMAIGAARMFGIRLPANFFSPYKAGSIVDFWRRWHMTLSRFLRDYLYIPLGGNRKSKARRYINLFLTMLLGGLWHGAAWTFVVWGALHGFYLIVNHLWTHLRGHARTLSARAAAHILTFFAVVAGWVIFRAENMDAAISILKSMTGLNGLSMPVQFFNYGLVPGFAADLLEKSTSGVYAGLAIAGAAMVSFLLPNSFQVMRRYRPMLLPGRDLMDKKPFISLLWRPNVIWGLIIALLFAVAIGGTFAGKSEFLYYNF
jgi:D-alanyl-lipoteichoic acid acyltransferase DltB (MBOAT superfamily)